MNNNLYNTNNNFVGTTHIDFLQLTSNLLAKQATYNSNALDFKINITSNLLVNQIVNTSNSLISFNKNYTDILRTDINKLIKEETETIILPSSTVQHTYIYNSNLVGEIRFWTKSTSSYPVINPFGVPDYRVKIGPNGHLSCYYTYDPLISLTFGNGWIDIANSIVNLNSADANFVISLTGIEAQVNNNYKLLQQQIVALIFALEDYTLVTQSQRIQIRDAVNAQSSFVRAETQSMTGALSAIRESAFSGYSAYATQGINTAVGIIANNPLSASFLGATGAVMYFLANKIFEQEYNTKTLGLMYQNVSNMNGITESKRNEYYSNIAYDRIRSYINITSNEYEINLIQGFLNCNLVSQQYLNNLHANIASIDILSGNIANINNIQTNNINANFGIFSNINNLQTNEISVVGKIKQNNILLDNTYLTSNHLYNLLNNYSVERQYPSKLFTNSTSEKTVTFLGKQVYNEALFLDTNVSYGNGAYELYSSSTYDNGITNKSKLFNSNISETVNTARWGLNLYNSGTGSYQGNNSIDGVYYGDWIIIKFPQEILLTKFRIYQNTNFTARSPSLWKVYGSDNGINFNEIPQAYQNTRLTQSNYVSNYYEKILSVGHTKLYSYIGFVFSALVSTAGETTLDFAQLQLYGKEIIGNTITGNIYCTSNAVKNIVEFSMPVISKHYAFYISITTPIVINGTTYYKYDVDLRQYTKLGYIDIGSQSGDSYRIFKLRACFGSMYFSTLVNGLPNVLYSDIFMSMKANPTANLGAAGLNICSIGNINNPRLDTVPPNNLFFMRNGANSIDYITIVSTNPADVRCFIEDMIS